MRAGRSLSGTISQRVRRRRYDVIVVDVIASRRSRRRRPFAFLSDCRLRFGGVLVDCTACLPAAIEFSCHA